MAKGSEGEHQQDHEKKTAEIGEDALADVGVFLLGRATLEPGGRLVNLGADVDHEKGRKRSDNKHAAPADEAK